MRPLPFNRCYWVVPGLLMAGCYPGSKNEAVARSRLNNLLNHGIRHVVNLMEPDEQDHAGQPFAPYESLFSSLAESEGVEVTFSRMPIKDLSAPGADQMVAILDTIDQHVDTGKPVYVHCFGGRGRTGTVIGCYLARHGHAVGKRVLWTIQKLRKNVFDFNLASPETLRQIELVVSWGKNA
ncbi:MAG: dual specificity protein phosphatase family protein [Desulfobacterales bacterium]|jgi:hypothetical protein|nr:dual specificity protein phosphatase family protein [Desulfobacterales bacterium]